MSVTDVGADKRIFLRKASGLIRTAGLADTFIYNIGVVSIGLGVGSMLYYGPAFYPQGDLIWGCVIACIAMAMISFGFITWTITLPRSGGIYVFGSRILPPSIALTMSLVEITAWLFYCAIAAYWIVILALAPMFGALNLLTGNEMFLTISQTMLKPWATFLIGAAILILSQIVLSYGMRFYLTVNKWVFILAMASTILMIVTLAVSSREQFMTNLNALVGPSLGVPDAYNAIIASGKEKGWGEAGFDLWQTLLVSNWPFLPLIGAAFSIAIGGEIKSVAKSQTVGMLGAVALATCRLDHYRLAGLPGVRLRVPRHRRVQRSHRQRRTDDADRSVHRAANRHSYAVAAHHHPHLPRFGPVDVDVDSGDAHLRRPRHRGLGVRPSGAGADRDDLGKISHPDRRDHRNHVVNLIFMALFVFSPWFAKIVILIEAAVLAWSVVLGAGIFFPYLRPQLYEKSPLDGKTVFGLPIMTVGCFLGFIAAQFYFWTLFFDPNAAGHDPTQVMIVAGVFVLGFVFYYVMKMIKKSQGIDVTLAFKEIPIE